jgi:RHS repeat-associated protein
LGFCWCFCWSQAWIHRDNANIAFVVRCRLGSCGEVSPTGIATALQALQANAGKNNSCALEKIKFVFLPFESMFKNINNDLRFVEREVLRDEVSTYGRLYDPVIARFFSPDNFVQAPECTQSYNRYSYCLNNPFVPAGHGSHRASPSYRALAPGGAITRQRGRAGASDSRPTANYSLLTANSSFASGNGTHAHYTYDSVSNITSITNSAAMLPNGLGGAYSSSYDFDNSLTYIIHTS